MLEVPEKFGDRGRNAIQMALAHELFGDSGMSGDEMILNWVNQGYAKRFDEYLKEHPEMDERLFIKREDGAFNELAKEILYH